MDVVGRRARHAAVAAALVAVAACAGGDATSTSTSTSAPPSTPPPSSTTRAPDDATTTATTATTAPTVKADPVPATTNKIATSTTVPTTALPRAPLVCDPEARRGDPVPWKRTATERAVELQAVTDSAPGVHVVEYALPDDTGEPWSQWGQGIVLADGRFLSAVGDHRGTDGRSFVHLFDPATGELTQEIDAHVVAGHVPGSTGYGKIHAPMIGGPCGEIYAATYWGSRRAVEYDGDYRGDALLRIDAATQTVENLGVIYPDHGVASMAISPDGSLLYVEAARPEPAGTGSFVVIDLASGDVVFADDADEHIGYRSIAVAADGSAYIAWENGRLARYDPADNALEVLADPVPGGGFLRWATEPLPDGSIIAVTRGPEQFFKITPDGGLVDLGPAPGYVTSLAATPDGSSVYFAPGAHGGTEMSGTVWRLDPADGTQAQILDVGALADGPLGARVGGSFNVALDAAANRLFVGFNAGGQGATDGGDFGRIVLAIIDLPGQGAGALATGLVCWSAPAAGTPAELEFADTTADAGLIDPLTGMRAHAVAFGDVNADGWLDVAVGTFTTSSPEDYQSRGATEPAPDAVLLGGPDGFTPDAGLLGAFGRTSGAVFVDLDGDGDDDLVLSRNVRERDGSDQAVTAIYERRDDGWRVADSGLDTTSAGRSVGVLDMDRDGLLDLVIAQDRYSGGSSRLYRNTGSLTFEPIVDALGWPTDVEGFGVATGDLNRDGWTDLLVAGSNRLFVGGPDGFTEVTQPMFEFETFGNEDIVTGADIGDLNGDGWPDLVIGQHFNSTVDFDTEVPVRVYLNTTGLNTTGLNTAGQAGRPPTFDDVSEQVGSAPLPTKAPHVQIADVDNDGRPDIVTSASAADGSRPAVLMNVGDADGLRFAVPDGLGDDQYWVATPAVDIDRDGRLDIFAIEWDPSLPSRLFTNRTAGGHWLQVSVDPAALGEPAVGTDVEIFEAGRAGDPGGLLGRREIVVSTGYTAGVPPIAHFGLGDRSEVEVVVTTPSGRTLTRTSAADQHLRFPAGCG